MTDLPSNWELVPLRDLGTWYGGGTPSKARADFWENGTVPWLSPKDMGADVIPETQDRITQAALESSTIRLVPAGSVAIVVRSGILERRLPIGLVPFDTTLNQDMKAVVPFEGIDLRWVAWGLRSLEQRILQECRKAGTTVASIEIPRLMELRFPIPPLEEQRRIIADLEDHISRLDVGQNTLGRLGLRTSSLVRSAMHAGVCGNLAGPGSQDVDAWLDGLRKRRAQLSPRSKKVADPRAIPGYSLPAGWRMVSLDSLSYANGYGTSTKCDYRAEGTPVLRIPNVQGGEIDLGDMKNAVDKTLNLTGLYIAPGDILFVRTNGSRDLIGRVAVVRERREIAFASYLIRFRIISEDILPEWVRMVVSSPLWRSYIEGKSASSAGQYNLSTQVLAPLPIPIPPQDEMREILAEVDKLTTFAVKADAERMQGERRSVFLKRSLLADAFMGRLVPQDPNDEPASVLLERIRVERAARQTLKRRARRTGPKTVESVSESSPRPEADTRPINDIPAPSFTPSKGTPVQETLL